MGHHTLPRRLNIAVETCPATFRDVKWMLLLGLGYVTGACPDGAPPTPKDLGNILTRLGLFSGRPHPHRAGAYSNSPTS